MNVKRCREAFEWGPFHRTRCARPADPMHTRHRGRGLRGLDEWVHWPHGAEGTFLSDRDDEHSWTELPK